MKRTAKRLLAVILTLSLVLSQLIFSSIAYAADNSNIIRLSGEDRYGTAVAISQNGWASGSDNVILARGDDFADALCAGPLAIINDAPILLTQPNNLDAKTLAEIKRLNAKHVIIIGGTGAISADVENAIKSAGITDIERIFGENRYATSVEIAKRLGQVSQIALATGRNFPDALSISPIASAHGMAILLTDRDSLPEEVAQYINGQNVSKTYIIGGTDVIGQGIANLFPDAKRLSGIDRYATNAAILKEFESVLDYTKVYVAAGDGANGDKFADALAGAVLAAKTNSPVILVYNSLADSLVNILKEKLLSGSVLIVLGGQAAVSSSVADAVTSIIPEEVTGGGGGGAAVKKVSSVAVTPNSIFLQDNDGLEPGQVTLIATVLPANATNKKVNWTSDTPEFASVGLTTGTVTGGEAGVATVTAASTDGTNKSDTCEVLVGDIVNLDLPDAGGTADLESSDTPVQVTANVNGVEVAIAFRNIPEGASITIVPTGDDATPEGISFAGLDISLSGFPEGTQVSIELPVPEGVDAPGAFHYNNGVWEYREAAVVDGKVVFTTNLSPVGISNILPTPTGLRGNYNNTTKQVTLNWNAVAEEGSTIVYSIVKNGTELAGYIEDVTSYVDANPVEGNNTYAVRAYRVVTSQNGDTLRFQSALSNTVTVNATNPLDRPAFTYFYGVDVEPGINTITVPFANVKKNAYIRVNRDVTLEVTVEGLGPFGGYELKEGIDNSVTNIPIPTVDADNLDAINMLSLLEALKKCDNDTKQQILDAINFTELFEIAKGTSSETKMDILDAIDFKNLLEGLENVPDEYRDAIYEDIANLIGLSVNDDNEVEIFNAINSAPLREVLADEKAELRQRFFDGTLTADDVRTVLNTIIDSPDTDTKHDIFNAINFTALFNAVKQHNTSAQKDAIFDAINFTNIFNAVKNFNSIRKSEVYSNMLDVLNILEDSGITRADLLDTIDFGAISRDDLFEWLSSIDGNSGEITVEATLTDADDITNTYTIIITNN